jgi:hypothetical protein
MNNSYDTPAESYGSSPAGTPQPSRSRRKRLFRWGTGITLAGFLAGGGIAWAATSGPSATGTSATGPTATGVSTVASSQGAVLNSALATAASTSSTVPARRVRSALARLRRVGGVAGEVTFHYQGGYRTLAFERGTIQSVSGSDVVVKAPDGTVWAWTIVSDTVVRKSGSKTTTSALSSGELVFAGGPVVNGDKDARLIVIGTPKSGSTPTPTPTSSGSDSDKTSVS